MQRVNDWPGSRLLRVNSAAPAESSASVMPEPDATRSCACGSTAASAVAHARLVNTTAADSAVRDQRGIPRVARALEVVTTSTLWISATDGVAGALGR